jgi:hypothetical protein
MVFILQCDEHRTSRRQALIRLKILSECADILLFEQVFDEVKPTSVTDSVVTFVRTIREIDRMPAGFARVSVSKKT